MSNRKSVKKEAPVEAAVKKEATVVEPVKGAEAAPQKGLRKKVQKAAPVKAERILVQFGAMEWNTEDLMTRAKEAYVADGHRASSIKSVSLYVKPEDMKAYFVINDKATGSIDL